jgi:hypothetical protein
MSIFGKKKGATPSGAGTLSFDPPADPAVTDAAPVDAPTTSDEGVVPESAPIEAVPAEGAAAMDATTAKPRFGFGRKEASAPVQKPVKMKLAKPPKAAKGSKVKAEEEISLPLTVVIDFYQGVTKEREAEQIVRANIEKNFDAPNASYFYIQRWREGMAVEMQEGGGRAYLPEILAKLDEDEDAVVAVPMSNRVAQVRLDPETRSLETLLLLNNQEPPADAFIAYPTRTMRPFDRRGSRLFVTGLGILAVSVMALLFSLGAFFLDKQAWALPYLQQTDVKVLPAGQMTAVENALSAGADCVYKLEYAGGWKVTPGYDSNGVCGTTRSAPAPAITETQPGDATLPPTTGGITAPSAAGAPGTVVNGVPGAVPGSVPPSSAPPVGIGAPVAGAVPAPVGR